MTSANIPAPVPGQDADAPDLAHGTGKDAPGADWTWTWEGSLSEHVRDYFVFV